MKEFIVMSSIHSMKSVSEWNRRTYSIIISLRFRGNKRIFLWNYFLWEIITLRINIEMRIQINWKMQVKRKIKWNDHCSLILIQLFFGHIWVQLICTNNEKNPDFALSACHMISGERWMCVFNSSTAKVHTIYM